MNLAIEKETVSRLEKLTSMIGEMFELGRMRSDFVLRHFVIGQHDTPGKQRAQALAELQSLYFAMADLFDTLAIARLDLVDLRRSRNEEVSEPRKEIEIRRKEREILSMEMHLAQRVKEIDCLLEILETMPSYTAAALEKEEPTYWTMRLARQAFLAPRDPGGNLDALLQMITEPGEFKPHVPTGPHDFLNGMGLETKQIAAGLLRLGLITPEGHDKMIEAAAPTNKAISDRRQKRR